MDIQELKEKYKAIPVHIRLLIVGVLALAPAAYTLYDEGSALDEKLVTARSLEDANRQAFERDRSKKGNLPKLEEQKAFTMEQLEKARKRLPDQVRIEDILQKAETIAKETGVRLKVFRPEKEVGGGDEFKYMELPITTEITGKFNQIASFYDRVVHLDGTVYLRKIDIAPLPAALQESGKKAQLSDAEKARRERADLTLAANFQIVVYRSMTIAEQNHAEAEAAEAAKGSGSGSGNRRKGAAPEPPAVYQGGAPVPPPTALNETTVIGGKRRF